MKVTVKAIPSTLVKDLILLVKKDHVREHTRRWSRVYCLCIAFAHHPSKEEAELLFLRVEKQKLIGVIFHEKAVFFHERSDRHSMGRVKSCESLLILIIAFPLIMYLDIGEVYNLAGFIYG